MDRAVSLDADVDASHQTCAGCGRALRLGRAFVFRLRPVQAPATLATQVNEVAKCIFCALRHWPMLRRSLVAAILVGTALTLLNQGDVLLFGRWSSDFYWKIPLTYCVPLGAATYGALINARR